MSDTDMSIKMEDNRALLPFRFCQTLWLALILTDRELLRKSQQFRLGDNLQNPVPLLPREARCRRASDRRRLRAPGKIHWRITPIPYCDSCQLRLFKLQLCQLQLDAEVVPYF